jgi:hypothetical protein
MINRGSLHHNVSITNYERDKDKSARYMEAAVDRSFAYNDRSANLS